MAALVSTLSGVSGIYFVTDKPITSAQIRDDQYPCILLYEGPDVISYAITDTMAIIFQCGMRLYNKTSINDIYGLMEAVLDALMDDITLGGTCVNLTVSDSDKPFPFEGEEGHSNYETFWDRILRIEYRRSY